MFKKLLPWYLLALVVLSFAFIYGCGSNPTGGGGGGGGGGGVVTHTLTVTVTPPTVGTVEVTPEGWTYLDGTTVEMRASTLDAGYMFGSWEGSVVGLTTPKTIIMNADKNVKAVFRPIILGSPWTLTVSVTPDLSGTVTWSPSAAAYADGTYVTLTASAAANYIFYGWGGDLIGFYTSPTTIEMTTSWEVTATFKHLFDLHVAVSPEGYGTVEPWGGTFTEGTVKSLTAEAKPGKGFLRWSGSITGTSNPISITMSANKSVTAEFQTCSISGKVTGGLATREGVIAAFLYNPLYSGGGPVTWEIVSHAATLEYNLVGLTPGKYYYISGFRDQDGSGGEPTDGDLLGSYPTYEAPVSVEVGSTDINFAFTHISGGGSGPDYISGQVSGGLTSRDAYVGALLEIPLPGETPSPVTMEALGPGATLSYTLVGLDPGKYYIFGFRDNDGSGGSPSTGDAMGAYPTYEAPVSVEVGSTDINFAYTHIEGGGGGGPYYITGEISGGDSSKDIIVAAVLENPLLPGTPTTVTWENAGTGDPVSYSLWGLDPGKYYIVGMRDTDGSGSIGGPTSGDVLGSYPTWDAPVSVEAGSIDKDFALTVTYTGEGGGGTETISGTVSGGVATRDAWVGACFENPNSGSPTAITYEVLSGATPSYTLCGLDTGKYYYIAGFRDNDDSGFGGGPTAGDSIGACPTWDAPVSVEAGSTGNDFAFTSTYEGGGGTETISGTVSGGLTSRDAWVVAMLEDPNAGPASPVTFENAGSGATPSYTLVGLDPGKYYYIAGMRDNDGTGTMGTTTPGDMIGAYPSWEGPVSVEAGSTDINFTFTYTYEGGGGGSLGGLDYLGVFAPFYDYSNTNCFTNLQISPDASPKTFYMDFGNGTNTVNGTWELKASGFSGVLDYTTSGYEFGPDFNYFYESPGRLVFAVTATPEGNGAIWTVSPTEEPVCDGSTYNLIRFPYCDGYYPHYPGDEIYYTGTMASGGSPYTGDFHLYGLTGEAHGGGDDIPFTYSGGLLIANIGGDVYLRLILSPANMMVGHAGSDAQNYTFMMGGKEYSYSSGDLTGKYFVGLYMDHYKTRYIAALGNANGVNISSISDLATSSDPSGINPGLISLEAALRTGVYSGTMTAGGNSFMCDTVVTKVGTEEDKFMLCGFISMEAITEGDEEDDYELGHFFLIEREE
jgi:uncharacterized protein (DUF2141 family)